jgi:hypothetical protein
LWGENSISVFGTLKRAAFSGDGKLREVRQQLPQAATLAQELLADKKNEDIAGAFDRSRQQTLR